MRILVTGGSGRVGRWVVRELVEHGYEVVNVDRVPLTVQDDAEGAEAMRAARTFNANLHNVRAISSVMDGCDRVIHLAAFNAPLYRPPEETFSHNTQATFCVLQAAADLGIQRAVIASSVSAIGMAYARHDFAPLYAPVDEAHPFLGQDPYALSKEVDESTAAMFHRQTGMTVAAMRFHWVSAPGEAAKMVERIRDDVQQHMTNLWGYVDARDVAQACRLALEVEGLGFEAFNVLAADTLREEPTEDLVRTYLPQVEIRQPMPGNTTAWSIDKARRLLGYSPQHTWRDDA
ncbi:MAG: NAD(P)-dependent oxidoreductase [Anaerolineae bacterium]|nr:NAD(P)-dependent oxidoreductase [Anaerolineae bacterium]